MVDLLNDIPNILAASVQSVPKFLAPVHSNLSSNLADANCLANSLNSNSAELKHNACGRTSEF